MEEKYVTIQKKGVTKKIDKKLVKDYVGAGWQVVNNQQTTYTKFSYQQHK